MTERKSTEIKIRVTPSEKARWQGEADRLGDSFSEWMRKILNGSCPLSPSSTHDFFYHGLGDYNAPNFEAGVTAGQASPESQKKLWSPESHPARVTVPYSKLATPSRRRSDYCTHLKPYYTFCPTCDR